ncbi:hypothetical protein IDE33_002804, partial [Enterococcus faecalis]|nr:hypothetical protein [Enterococcus faecalis]
MCEIAKVDGVTKRLEKARLHLNQIIADPSIVFAVNSNQLEATQQQIKTLIKDISKKD